MITKKQLDQYITEYNKTHEGKCIPTWEESTYYVLLANDYRHIITYYVRKFKTKGDAKQYIDNKSWEKYLSGHTKARPISYDEIVNQYSIELIPNKYFSKKPIDKQ